MRAGALMGRVYVRKFDHDEARRLYAAGVRIGRIAAEMNVSWTAVQRVVVPGAEERMRANKAAWNARGVCDVCGGPMSNHSRTTGSTMCRDCGHAAQTKVRDGNAYCPTCDTWKPTNEFSPSAQRSVRGVHGECRVCDTRRRRENRRRNPEASRDYDREYKRRRRAAQQGAVT